jgi:heme-degrading monooxygenase HmoA
MKQLNPIVVLTSFRLRPESTREWQAAWTRVQRHALSDPACHSFRLLRNPKDSGDYAALSEWNSAQDFNSFVRRSGLIWMDRTHNHFQTHSQYIYFEPVGEDAPLPTLVREERVLVHR